MKFLCHVLCFFPLRLLYKTKWYGMYEKKLQFMSSFCNVGVVQDQITDFFKDFDVEIGFG